MCVYIIGVGIYIGSFRVYRQIGMTYKYIYYIHYTYTSVTADRLRRQTQSAPGLKSAVPAAYSVYTYNTRI